MTRRSSIAVGRETVLLSAFIVICLLILAVLSVQLLGAQLTAQNSYQADFTNVGGLKTNDEVMIAGVQVGSVTSVTLRDNTPVVGFTVNRSTTLPKNTHATIVYKDLLGNLYLQLSPGSGPAGGRLASGATLPRSQTSPALDLDSLLGGFQPLFQGLQPGQINQLSTELVSVLQGQGGTIDTLLEQIGSLTNSLADRTAVIDSVVTNLNSVLGTVNKNGGQLSTTLTRLQQLISGLSASRQVIGGSISKIGSMAGSLTQLLDQARPPLRGAVTQFNQLAATLAAGDQQINSDLQQFPQFYSDFAGIGTYGSFSNVYLCGLQIETSGPGGKTELTPWIKSNNNIPRCKVKS